jgi:hypothetical protein
MQGATNNMQIIMTNPTAEDIALRDKERNELSRKRDLETFMGGISTIEHIQRDTSLTIDEKVNGTLDVLKNTVCIGGKHMYQCAEEHMERDREITEVKRGRVEDKARIESLEIQSKNNQEWFEKTRDQAIIISTGTIALSAMGASMVALEVSTGGAFNIAPIVALGTAGFIMGGMAAFSDPKAREESWKNHYKEKYLVQFPNATPEELERHATLMYEEKCRRDQPVD